MTQHSPQHLLALATVAVDLDVQDSLASGCSTEEACLLALAVDDDAIRSLRDEAVSGGDSDQVDLCNIALQSPKGDPARKQCAKTIFDARINAVVPII